MKYILKFCKLIRSHEQQNHCWWLPTSVCWSAYCSILIVGITVDTESLQQQTQQHFCCCWLDANAVSALVMLDFEGNFSQQQQQHHLCCLMLMLLRPWPPRRSAAAGKIQSGILLLICFAPTRHLCKTGYLPQARHYRISPGSYIQVKTSNKVWRTRQIVEAAVRTSPL